MVCYGTPLLSVSFEPAFERAGMDLPWAAWKSREQHAAQTEGAPRTVRPRALPRSVVGASRRGVWWGSAMKAARASMYPALAPQLDVWHVLNE